MSRPGRVMTDKPFGVNLTILPSATPPPYALESGNIDAGLVWAGLVQGLIHDVPSCAELIERIMSDAREIVSRRLSAFAEAPVVSREKLAVKFPA